MSDHHVSFKDLPAGGEKFEPAKASKLVALFGGLGALGIAGSIYYFSNGATRPAFSYSWLFAIFFSFTFVAGGCFWILLHNASNSSWGVVIRRLFENLGSLALPLGVLAVPLMFPGVQTHLWEWMNHHRAAGSFEGLEEAAKVKAAAEYELQAERSLANALDALGMTPTSRAKLGLDLQPAFFQHVQLGADVRQVAAATARGVAEAPVLLLGGAGGIESVFTVLALRDLWQPGRRIRLGLALAVAGLGERSALAAEGQTLAEHHAPDHHVPAKRRRGHGLLGQRRGAQSGAVDDGHALRLDLAVDLGQALDRQRHRRRREARRSL